MMNIKYKKYKNILVTMIYIDKVLIQIIKHIEKIITRVNYANVECMAIPLCKLLSSMLMNMSILQLICYFEF